MEEIKNKYSTNTIVLIGMILLIIGISFTFVRALKAQENEFVNKINQLTSQNAELVKQLAEAKNQYVTMDTKTHRETEIVYVEKTSKNDADVEVNKKPPKVVVNAGDGKSYEYTPDMKSLETIKDGKVVINEDNTLTLDIEKIVEDRFKDKIDVIKTDYQNQLDKKNIELDKINKVLKRTKKQRDFYAGTTIVGVGTGTVVMVHKSM